MSAASVGKLAGAALVLMFGAGCGASSWVVADHSSYPISMSNGLRDADGTVLKADRKEKVGEFEMDYKACSMLWRIVSFTGDKDISEPVNEQVKAKGGDAITNLTVSSGSTIWNLFTVIGILPDCSSVKIAGDIVKVKAAASAPAPVAPPPVAAPAPAAAPAAALSPAPAVAPANTPPAVAAP